MAKWKCTNCGNRVAQSNPPIVCGISCCKQSGTYVLDDTPGDLLTATWKCANCGNREAGTTAPIVCRISCCQASNSYIKI